MVQEHESKEQRVFGTNTGCGQEREEGRATDEVGSFRQGKLESPLLVCALDSFGYVMQVMIDMGFEVDASTAGSSVRFQPPDPALRSISFHKRKCLSYSHGPVFSNKIITLDIAHPESTIDPITLQKWRKKLKNYYGWSEEILFQHANQQL